MTFRRNSTIARRSWPIFPIKFIPIISWSKDSDTDFKLIRIGMGS